MVRYVTSNICSFICRGKAIMSPANVTRVSQTIHDNVAILIDIPHDPINAKELLIFSLATK